MRKEKKKSNTYVLSILPNNLVNHGIKKNWLVIEYKF